MSTAARAGRRPFPPDVAHLYRIEPTYRRFVASQIVGALDDGTIAPLQRYFIKQALSPSRRARGDYLIAALLCEVLKKPALALDLRWAILDVATE